ncbi:MAG: hypothetical protein ACI8X5_000543 [Planctomycetota bacterium]|jgi:hypothetical protein
MVLYTTLLLLAAFAPQSVQVLKSEGESALLSLEGEVFHRTPFSVEGLRYINFPEGDGYVQNASAGTWTIEVLADEINQDGHVETGALDTDYALVINGVEGPVICVPPTTYCTGKISSLGQVPSIGWNGEQALTSTDFEITITNAVPNKTALVFWGPAAGSAPFQGATLCVQAPITRGTPFTTGILGSGAWPVDLAGKTAGDTEYYQVWYRDPTEPAGFGTGLTGGLSVIYCE